VPPPSQSNGAAALELKEAEAMLAKRSTIDTRELVYSGGRLVINQVGQFSRCFQLPFSQPVRNSAEKESYGIVSSH